MFLDRSSQTAMTEIATAATGWWATRSFPVSAEDASGKEKPADPFSELRRREMPQVWDIIAAKIEACKILAEEAIRRAGAASACVRRYMERHNELWLATYAGRGWTPENRDLVYPADQTSLGWTCVRRDEAVYLSQVTPASAFRSIFDFTKSVYGIPWHSRGKAGGVLTVDWDVVNGLSDDGKRDLNDLMRVFEDTIAFLNSEEESRFQVVLRSVNVSGSAEQVYRDLVDRLRSQLGARTCTLFLADSAGTQLRIAATTLEIENHANIPAYSFGEGLTGWVAKNRRSLRLRDVANESELKAIAPDLYWKKEWEEPVEYTDRLGHLTFVAAPVLDQGRVLGVIRSWLKDGTGEFERADQILMELVAERAASLIKTALGLGWKPATPPAGAATDGMQVLCDMLAGALTELTPAIGASFAVYPEANTEGGWVGLAGIFREASTQTSSRTASDSPPLTVEPPAKEPSLLFVDLLDPDDRTRPIGKALLAYEEESQKEEAERGRSVVGFLSRVATFIQPLRDATRKSKELKRLHEIGRNLAQQTDLAAVLERVREAALEESGMDTGTIRFYDATRGMWVLHASARGSGPEPAYLPNNSILSRSAHSEGPVYVRDTHIDVDRRAYSTSLPAGELKNYFDDCKSSVHIPIRKGRTCLGLILLDSTERVIDLSEDQLDYLEILAGYAALAVSVYRAQESRLKLAEPFALLGVMLGGFLHDIRNQLNNAIAVLTVMGDEYFDPRRLPDKIADLRQLLARIHSVCIDLARFASQGTSAAVESVDLNSVVDRVLANTEGWEKNRVRVHKGYHKGSPTIRGNAIQIEIAMRMVIQNAVEAMPSGGDLYVETEAGDATILRFRDTGIGMDRVTLEKCRDGFYSSKPGGTGLGVRVVEGIMLRHGGRIEIESELNVGTTVSLLFPRIKENEHAERSAGR
jgi:signal transduction histidine kinase